MKFLSKLLFSMYLIIWAGTAFAQFPYQETFKGSVAPGIVFGGSALLTAGSSIDLDGAGYLRLTNNQANQAGFIRNTLQFPSAQGLEVSFEYYTYGGSGADGIVFFLFDASASSAFQIGGYGGSLGYSPRSDLTLPGLSKAFIGFAIDEFGNFSKPNQGRVGGPGQMQSSVSIRGDGDGSGTVQAGSSLANSNYEYLMGLQTTNLNEMSAIGAGSVFQIAGGQNGRTAPGGTLDPNEAGYRKARIVLENNGLGTGYKINVFVRLGTESIERHLIVDYNYLSTLVPATNLSYGFASSTGGANNFHEIRNVQITVPSSAPKKPLLAGLSKSGNKNQTIAFSRADFYQGDFALSAFKDPNGDSLSKIQIKSLPANGQLKLNGQAIFLNQEIINSEISNLTYSPNQNFNGSDVFTWNGADQGGLYALADANIAITVNDVEEAPLADLFRIRIKLANPTHATYRHAENPYNKSMVSIFQVDDSPATVYNLMYPYLKGGTTAGGFVSPGVKSSDGCGNNLFWNISVACFINDVNGQDLLEQGGNYISWPQLAIVTANSPGLQRGFDYMNHGFGGSAILQRDRYKQIFLNNKAFYDHLGYNPESLVVPDVQIGFRFGAHSMGMDVTSQAGPDPLKDGVEPLAQDAFSEQVYAAVQNPYFLRRNHWQETNNQALVAEHKAYILSAFNKSKTKPMMYNWFSHGPGENGTNNFAYYREVIEYMQSLAGDNVIGLSLDQYLGYQKTRYAAEHGSRKMSRLTEDGYLEISFDMSDLQKTARHRLISLIIDSDAHIDSISWSENIKAVTFNPSTGLVNIQLNEIVSVDPATLAVRPTIIAGTPIISASSPKKIRFELDRPISQSVAKAYEIEGNTVLSISEVPNSGGLIWEIVCQNDFLSTDVIELTYKAEIGNAVDLENGSIMLTYSKLPVVNLSEETIPEVAPLAISIRRDSDNLQLATFNTVEEVKTYMNTFNFNTNISIVLNSDSTYRLSSKWTLNYNNGAYTLTIKGKERLSSNPVIDGNGNISDIFRIAMSHVRIDRLKIRSGKYVADGAAFGDNYSGALISQQANTSDIRYTNLILHQGMRGMRIGAANGTNQPNISEVLIDQVVFTELTGIAIQVGIINSISGQPESRTDASYSLNNVIIRNVTVKDTKNQGFIENSGARYSGQVQCRGVNNLTLQDIVSDQNQKQPFYIIASKNVLIDRCKATNFSLNTGSGYKAAFHIESSELITIQNSFAQHTFENVYILGSSGIKLYYNTFDTQQASVRAVSMSDVRLVQDIQGNIIAAKGDNIYNSCFGISFYRGAGYIPTIANDFVSEQNNLFIAQSNILEFSGLDAGNTPLSVRVAFPTTFANYKSNYARGQNSVVSPYSSLSFTEVNGVYGYLASNSVGRNFVASQISSINVDLANHLRSYPSSAGAYDSGELISENLLELSISSSMLSPVFTATDTSYTASVPNSIGSITFTPVLVDELSTIEYRINSGAYFSTSNGSESAPLTLAVGQNIINLKVSTADNNKSKIYTIIITRAGLLFSIAPIPNASVNENTSYIGTSPVINGIPYGNLKYTLSGSDAFDFSIDHASGVVSMMPANFESPADANADNIYELTINATDEGNVKVSRDWTISILNVQESATFTIGAIQDTTVNENTAFEGVNPVITGQPIVSSASRNFTLVPIPDTQYYTAQINDGNNSIFKSQANWIVNNKNALNIKYLVHLGDGVENGDGPSSEIEWMRADTVMSILENPVSTQLPNGIPYGINVGNHDQSPIGNASGTTTMFNQYFGTDRFAGRNYYGGHYGTSNDNNYQLFSAGGMDFIAVNLEFDPTANPQVLTWSDNLLKTHSDRRAIISSHYIINANGSFGTQGQAIYDKLKFNPNLFLMLCGHINPNGESRRTDTFNGNTVHTLLSDFQDRPNGGNGWMRYMEFMPNEGKIAVSTYSPFLDRYETDSNSRFVLDYEMLDDSISKSVVYTLGGADASAFTIDSSTGKVSMIPRNFESPADIDNVYELSIIATDADGNQATKGFKITTLDIIEPADFQIAQIGNLTIEENNIFTGIPPVIEGTTIGKLKYSLGGIDSTYFTVDSVSGVVAMSGKNYDEPSDKNLDNIYEVTLIAVDEDQNSAERTFTVRITPGSPFPYSETFKNLTASGIILGGAPNTALLTAGTFDSNGLGYLRLTNNSNNQTGFARNSRLFPADKGLSVSFEYYTYGGSGADGLTFFLYDAKANPFNPGGFGGSMGYAQSSSSPGLSKAFLGVGFDEFGNFSAPLAGRQGGPGTRPSSVVLRGDGNGAQTIPTNYEYLSGLQTSDAIAMSAAGAGNAFQIAGGVDGRIAGGLSPFIQGYRRVKIDIVPNEAPTNGFIINVWIIEGNENGGILHQVIKNYNYIPNDSIPALLNYGFSAGTGGKNNFHEIRNLEIRLPNHEPPPVVVDFSKTLDKNNVLAFSSEDFKSNYSSPEFKLLHKIKVISLPDSGTLKLGLNVIVPGQEFLLSDISQLTFNPIPEYHGADGFLWNGSDGDNYADSSAKVNINIREASVLPYSESFKNSTAAGMHFGGSPNPAILTAGNLDTEGAGYLRLTSNAKNQNGFARNSTAFSMSEGLSISFEYYTHGGSGADGLTFFLYDALANSNFHIGAPGGSMAYAQNFSLPGLSKAYLGFGFDEFGNFSAAAAGRQGGPGQRPSSLTIRGDGDGSTLISSNYEYVTGIQTSNSAAMSSAVAGAPFLIAGNVNGRTAGASGLSSTDNGYRKAQIELKPNASGTGFIINVWLTEGSISGGIVHHLVKDYSYVGNTLPENLSYGFSGSTGGATNFHEIRNLSIRVPETFEVPIMMSVLDKSFGNRWSAFSNIKQEQDKVLNATNLISPNGDGLNDTWIIRNIEFYPENAVRIFNKRGQLVYSISNYNNEWDGTSMGTLLPEDTYYYIIDFSKSDTQMKGYISILR